MLNLHKSVTPETEKSSKSITRDIYVCIRTGQFDDETTLHILDYDPELLKTNSYTPPYLSIHTQQVTIDFPDNIENIILEKKLEKEQKREDIIGCFSEYIESGESLSDDLQTVKDKFKQFNKKIQELN